MSRKPDQVARSRDAAGRGVVAADKWMEVEGVAILKDRGGLPRWVDYVVGGNASREQRRMMICERLGRQALLVEWRRRDGWKI